MAGQEAIDRLELGDHVCWAFDDELCLRSVARYVAAGLQAEQRVLYFTHGSLPRAVIAGLGAFGVPVDEAVCRGQLVVRAAADSYLSTGEFDADAMTYAWPQETARACREGFAGLRVVGDMAWAAEEPSGKLRGAQDLLRYEGQVNRVFAHAKAMAVCLYDRRLFAAGELAALSAVHPGTLVDRADGGWLPLLRIRYTDQPPGLRLSGAVDASNRDSLPGLLTTLPTLAEGRQKLVIDVSALTFADAGSAVMLARTVRAGQGRVRLQGCSPGLQRLLGLVWGEDWRAPGVEATG